MRIYQAEVQAFFELKGNDYVLKPEVYSVGRGVATLPGTTSGGIDYVGKRDFADTKQTQKHDFGQILKNDELLRSTSNIVRQIVKNKEEGVKKGLKEVERWKNKVEAKVNRQLEKGKSDRFETRINVKGADKRTNTYILNSSIEMPDIVKKIYDTSFTAMANTEVQYISRDVEGNLLNKEKLGDKKFECRR